MEGNSIEQYLKCYQQLSQPTLSKKANRTLLDIEASLEAWNIACQLMSTTDTELNLHGVQLLSKKLNTPPPKEINIETYFQFLAAIEKKASLVWLCLAKTILHLSPETPLLPKNLSPNDVLKLCKEIPAALSHVRTQIPTDSTHLKNGYLNLILPILKSQTTSNSQLVLEVLDAFVSYGTRIKDQDIVKFLLKLPFEEGGHILEEIISREPFPTLTNELVLYLEKQRKDQSAFDIHAAFFRLADLNLLQFEQFRSSMEYILTCLNQQSKEACTLLCQSYQLWHGIANQLKNTQLTQDKKQIIKEALLTLWNIVCKRSVLVELPEHCIKPQTALAIDVDEDDENQVPPSNQGANKEAQYFRTYSQDFITLCVSSMKELPQALSTMFQIVQNLALGELLHLELAIFIVTSLTPCTEILTEAAPIIRNIFSRATELNEYLCSKVIDMIGDLSSLLTTVPDLATNMLLFLSGSLTYPSLAPIASVSCCTLLEQLQQSQSHLSQSMQQFLTHAYQILFKQDSPFSVVQNLSRAMVIFLYKFKQTPKDYHNYLQIYHQRCSQLHKEKQLKLIETAIAGQLWINSREEIKQEEQNITNNQYIPVFTHYLEKQVQVFIDALNSAQKKKNVNQIVVCVNLAIRTNAVGNGIVWAELCDYILTQYQTVSPPLPVTITPLINLTKAATDLNSNNLASSVSVALNKWHRPITQLLDFTLTRCEFTLSVTILNLHLKIIQFIKKYPNLLNEINYDPKIIVNYILSVLNKQDIWEYDIFKNGLNYLLVALQLGYPPNQVLHCLLKNIGKLQETLWTALEPIFMLVYQKYGFTLFSQSFSSLNSPLADNNNPLSHLLQQALSQGESKTVKNLFLSL